MTALLGESTCIVKGEPCQLLALALGEPETLVFGPRGLTYRVKLERIGTLKATPKNGNKSAPATEGGGKSGTGTGS